MSEDEFWNTADKFRDPRIWHIEDNKWWKDTIWGEKTSYGSVALSTLEVQDFNDRRKRLESDGKVL